MKPGGHSPMLIALDLAECFAGPICEGDGDTDGRQLR
jgi:hypothetical protein